MPWVSSMDENYNLDGFDSVWQRVIERSDEPEQKLEAQAERHEEKICLVKSKDNSCAVRFIPKF